MDNFSYYEPPKPPIPWRLIAIIGGTVVLVVLVILGARWLVLNKTEAGRQAVIVNNLEKELDKNLLACEKEKNSANCQANLVEEAAMKAGAVEVCARLTDSALDTCVVKVARENFDAAGCDLMTTEEKQTSCKDLIYRALATNEMDLSWCEKISSEDIRERCVKNMTEAIAREEGCSGTGVDQSVCDSLAAFDQIVASEDPDLCMTLVDNDEQINCLEAVGPGDRDHDNLSASLENSLGSSDTDLDSDDDGLTDYDEYKVYGSELDKPDTDGDGYNDGDEVENGYNPLGGGKL